MKEAAKRRWAERKARESDEHQKELELEAYHKGNVVPINKPNKPVVKSSSEPVLVHFEIDGHVHDLGYSVLQEALLPYMVFLP